MTQYGSFRYKDGGFSLVSTAITAFSEVAGTVTFSGTGTTGAGSVSFTVIVVLGSPDTFELHVTGAETYNRSATPLLSGASELLTGAGPSKGLRIRTDAVDVQMPTAKVDLS